MIANPVDHKLKETVRNIEEHDLSSPLSRLYVRIAERIGNMEEPVLDDFDLNDPEQKAIWKTVQVLLNKVIYADGYLDQ
jgi:hypothetical protein